VFDLDPDPDLDWKRVVQITKTLRALLEGLSLVPFLRATGGKGLHVVAPLVRRSTWQELKTFSHAVALALARVEPDKVTAVMTKSRRRGKIFIDYLRNAPEATAIASYSTRARPGAPVALPLFWEELDELDGPLQSSVREVPERLRRGDPWRSFEKSRRSLSGAARQLAELTG
jgi:bifunctional non-homologous end joining protein LigD